MSFPVIEDLIRGRSDSNQDDFLIGRLKNLLRLIPFSVPPDFQTLVRWDASFL